jgi:phospholipid transport system substrate-binding protein
MGVRPAWETPDALIKRVSSDVLESIKTDKAVQAGETSRVISLVDSRSFHVNFVRMTASAVAAIRAPLNNKAPAGRIQDPVDSRTYSGALAVKDQSVTSSLFVRQPVKPSWWCAAGAGPGDPVGWTTAWKKQPPDGRFMT